MISLTSGVNYPSNIGYTTINQKATKVRFQTQEFMELSVEANFPAKNFLVILNEMFGWTDGGGQ